MFSIEQTVMTLPLRVADDLVLYLFPAGDAPLDEHLVYGRQAQAVGRDIAQLLLIRDAAAAAAERERRADDDGVADLCANSPRPATLW
jgi:hypothetical protein